MLLHFALVRYIVLSGIPSWAFYVLRIDKNIFSSSHKLPDFFRSILTKFGCPRYVVVKDPI